MRKISCFVANYEGYGYFVGCLLQRYTENIERVKKSVEFYNLLTVELENFLEIYEYSRENCEKYFQRPIGLFKSVYIRQDGKRCWKLDLIEAPVSLQNAIWFQDARSSSVSRCAKCPTEDIRCKLCQTKFDAEVQLLQISQPEIKKHLAALPIVPVADIREALLYIGVNAAYEVLRPANLYYLEVKYDCHFFMYRKNAEERTEVLHAPTKTRKFMVRLMLFEPYPATKNGEIKNFGIIQDETLLPTKYVCRKTKGCNYVTYKSFNYARHQKTCGKTNVQTIEHKQVSYGMDNTTLRKMVDENILPEAALDYRNYDLATFDIETIEAPMDLCPREHGMETNANLKLLSIAVGSNIADYEPKCWIRKSLDPSEEKRLIKSFLRELEYIYELKRAALPDWISAAYTKLNDLEDSLKAKKAKWNEFLFLTRYRRELKKFTCLDIYGFNSSRFDIPCIAASLFFELDKMHGKITILKKGIAYLSVSTSKFHFKDAIKFTSPCALDDFMKNWEAPAQKGIWPYSLYNTIEEIKSAKKFPPISAFASSLKGGARPSMATYIAEKTEFYRLKLLPRGHSERILSMYGFLRRYNLLDVVPFAHALENCFKCYAEYFHVNPMTALSLPALASTAMFASAESKHPLVFTFAEKNKNINEIFRASVFGGIVNAFRRHVKTFDDEEVVPYAARHAPNGDTFTTILSLDFTSMYLSCQMKEMPTSPGILWEMGSDQVFKKSTMTPGRTHSFAAQQWLTYCQHYGG